ASQRALRALGGGPPPMTRGWPGICSAEGGWSDRWRRRPDSPTLEVMDTQVAVALALTLASACALNWGYLREHGAASRLPPLSVGRPLRSLHLLLASRAWLGGFFWETIGFGLYVAALALAPLALVQAVAAGGIGILALLVARVSGS